MSKNKTFVLVAGGAEYIGGVPVAMLQRRGYRVRVFDELFFGDDGLPDAANWSDTLLTGMQCPQDTQPSFPSGEAGA